jgi:hypothetical protein
VWRTYRYLSGSKLRRLFNCMRAPGVQAVVVLRCGQWLATRSILLRVFLEPVYFLLNGLMKILWGIELPRSARIGPGLYIGHFGGITVSGGAVIGNNCNLSQNVTIGEAGFGEAYGVPVIGDNAYIAVGARLFGKITIGNNVRSAPTRLSTRMCRTMRSWRLIRDSGSFHSMGMDRMFPQCLRKRVLQSLEGRKTGPAQSGSAPPSLPGIVTSSAVEFFGSFLRRRGVLSGCPVKHSSHNGPMTARDVSSKYRVGHAEQSGPKCHSWVPRLRRYACFLRSITMAG